MPQACSNSEHGSLGLLHRGFGIRPEPVLVSKNEKVAQQH